MHATQMLMSIVPAPMNRPVTNSSESPGRKNISSPHSTKMMTSTATKAQVPKRSRMDSGCSQLGPMASVEVQGKGTDEGRSLGGLLLTAGLRAR